MSSLDPRRLLVGRTRRVLTLGRPALLALLLVGAGCRPGRVAPADPPGINVLLIGNSYTYWNDLPGMLAGLLDSTGFAEHRIESLAFPAWGLDEHWQVGAAQREIARGGWDVVVVQHGATTVQDRDVLLEYTRRYAREAARVGARLALYMVWPRASRSSDFNAVSESYAIAANENDALLFPAGEAWRAAWRRDPVLELYGPDALHPTPMGTYLAVLVMYEQLTGRSPVGTPGTIWIEGRDEPVVAFPPRLARLLQAAAAEANAMYARAPAGTGTP